MPSSYLWGKFSSVSWEMCERYCNKLVFMFLFFQAWASKAMELWFYLLGQYLFFFPSIQYIISCLIFLPFLTVSVCKYFYFTHTWSCLFVQVIPDSTHFLSSLLSLPFLWTPLCHPQSFSLRYLFMIFSLYHSMYYMCLCLIYHLSSIIYHHLL